MSRLRIARIPYLNSAPFYGRLGELDADIVDLPPRELGRVAAAGDVDAGIFSLCDLFRSSEFEPLGALGVAADGPVHSVLLFGRRPPAELGGTDVAVTTETSTSYPLLRLLLEDHYGVRIRSFVRRPPEAGDAAALLIGDAALREAAGCGLVPGATDYGPGLLEVAGPQGWRWVLDLSAAWRRWQGLPFCFARWGVRRGVADEDRHRLLEAIDGSLDDSLRRLRELAASQAREVDLDPDAAYHYLMGFTYRLGEREQRAIRTFRGLLAGAPWWEGARPAAVSRQVS